MNQRYSAALQLSLLIVVVFSLIVSVVFYFYRGTLAPLFEGIVYVIICQLCLFFFSFVLIQKRIENFILTKVKSLYQDLLPTGIPLNEDSLQKMLFPLPRVYKSLQKKVNLKLNCSKTKKIIEENSSGI